MPFHMTCACGRLTIVADEKAGTTVRCVSCHAEMRVPALTAPPPPPPLSTEPIDQPHIVAAPPWSPRGKRRDPRRPTLHLLCASIFLLALLNIAPVLVAIPSSAPDPSIVLPARHTLENWGVIGIALASLHVAYCVYLLQLPARASLSVVSLFLLLVASAYALLMAVRLFGTENHQLVQWLALDHHRFTAGQQALWCFLLVLLSGLVSYLTGRAATRWGRTDEKTIGPASSRVLRAEETATPHSDSRHNPPDR